MSHSHRLVEDPDVPEQVASQSLRRWLTAALLPFVVATIVGLVVLWPSDGGPRLDPGTGPESELVRGSVTAVEPLSCDRAQESPADAECRLLTVELESGDTVPVEDLGSRGSVEIERGTGVVLAYEPTADEGQQYALVDLQRGGPLLALAVIFTIAVLVLGRWRGVAALGGLAVTFAALQWFVLPALLDGSSPVAVAVVGAAAIMFVALYLTHGVSTKTTVAVLGTLASLLLIAGLAAAVIAASQFSGIASEEAAFLSTSVGNVDLRGLLLAGVLIGSLGVLDDVTITQASSVWELRRAQPAYSAPQLYRAGVRIGRDHIASTVNTLVLAYAGASLPLLLLFSVSEQSLTDVITGEQVAQEVVRALAGAVGLVASVPLTTALAAVVCTRLRMAGGPAVEPVATSAEPGSSASDPVG